MGRSLLSFLSLVLTLCPLVTGHSFLGESHGSVDALRLSRDLRRAMDEVMGCGPGVVDTERRVAIQKAILPMWETLPRNALDRVDWKTLRYIAHRYFIQQSSLIVRGFEPSLLVNGSVTGAADILSKQVPAHVDLLLGQGHSSAGFSLEDSAIFLGALEQLIFDSETKLLEQAYQDQTILTRWSISQDQLQEILEVYISRWIVGEDKETLAELMNDRSILGELIPNWDGVKEFIEGRIRTLAFARAQSPLAGHGQSLLHSAYSFADAHEIAGSLTSTFQSFWQSECDAMKEKLISKDEDATGRVSIGDFYGDGSDEQWHFGESGAYLSDLGALDVSDPTRGVQVLIPNYLQAASNCIMSGPHYLVCCRNECEGIFGEIEANISASMATPEDIFAVVDPLRAEESGGPRPHKRRVALAAQLERIAAANGGQVPLHSRLFAQWLHYAFPRECPFPHKAGEFAGHTLTTNAYGMENAIATGDEIELHGKISQKVKQLVQLENLEESNLMTQWSDDEELFADYAGQHGFPELRDNTAFHSALLVLTCMALAAAACATSGRPDTAEPKVHRI